MPRNAEVIRQWQILRTLEATRHGVTIKALSRQFGVAERTIWRDVAALQEAGFPLVDEKSSGPTKWRLLPNGLKALDNSSLTVAELAALYFSRALVQCLVGTPFQEDARTAMEKIARALPQRMRKFVDQLPAVLNVKAAPMKRRDDARYRKHIAALLSAVLEHRQVKMQYASAASRQTKEYLVNPYRLAYAQGGMYLLAFVPKYRQLRTFAVERIKSASATAASFDAPDGASTEPFANSLGVHTGPAERVEIEFLPEAAAYVRERTWHPTQQLKERSDGSVRLTLSVCHDWALRSWILGFGPLARVISPSTLAEAILEQLEEARDGYAPHLDFEIRTTPLDANVQPELPLGRHIGSDRPS